MLACPRLSDESPLGERLLSVSKHRATNHWLLHYVTKRHRLARRGGPIVAQVRDPVRVLAELDAELLRHVLQ